MDKLLQWVAGGFYLLNKIFFVLSERAQINGNQKVARYWMIAAWAILFPGLPAWVIIFIQHRNWIAAAVETSAVPTLVLGLVIAMRGTANNPPRALDYLAAVSALIGFSYSLYDFKGINTVNQWVETGLVLSFLAGTYLLAKKKPSGYLCYALMHTNCGTLMWMQDKEWLAIQQAASLVLMVYAYCITRKRKEPDEDMKVQDPS